jgi:putative protease
MPEKIELLAPAGNLLKLNYAFAFGADAVYAGVPKFSLRARENEFDQASVEEAVAVARGIGKKIYLTLNIFPHNRKLESFISTLQWMESLKPDAIIVSDPGIIQLSRQYCPSVPLHLSTQANTVNWASVKFWQAQGIRRIILSREISVDEIREIRLQVPEIELESFVHGAICVAYSGRCLLSNYFTHRDPNQGTCTHSCRWDYKIYTQEDFVDNDNYQPLKGSYFLEESERPGEYLPIDEDENGTYIMNARDLCAIGILKRLAEAGVNSFKIEGRNKSIYYLGIITRAYRQAVDQMLAGRNFDVDLEKEMFAVANRGYTTGFLEKNPGHLGENFFSSQSSNQTYIFCANVRQIDQRKGRALITVRNRFETGDEVEAIYPGGQILFKIEKIWSEEGQPLSIAHGGGQDVWINIPAEADIYTLIRKKIQ